MSFTHYAAAAEDLHENTEQWAAYESTGNCVILAGPGSGKTKTITIKMARLLAEDLRPPRRLACITYSNACVAELRSRLKGLGIEDGERLSLSSVHSFCLTELVLPYAKLAGLAVPDPVRVATPAQSREIFRQAQISALGSEQKAWFRTTCDKLRRTIPDRDSSEWIRWDRRQTSVVESYEEGLLESGLIDFDGMVLAGLELIERHAWVRKAIQAKYPLIVIDEYQDLGLPLHRMVLALMNQAGVRIIAVGDPDQSIYGFTGAKPSLLRTLGELPSVQSIRLRLNYRCAEKIIAASQTLLTNPGDFESHDGRTGEIQIYQLGINVQGQSDYALGRMVPKMLTQNPDWRPGDVAMLYQTKNEGNTIAASADALGLKYFRSDTGSPIKRSRLTDWLIDAARWCSGEWATGSVSLSQILNRWRLMRRSLTRDTNALMARSRLIKVLFANRNGGMALHAWLKVLNEAVLKEAFEEEPGLADEEGNFSDLMEASGAKGALAQYTIEIFGNQGKDPDRINLMTLHGSKGLEFQSVIMIGLEEGSFPSSMARTKEELEESARLFYVGVTRAKTQVHLVYNQEESPLITMIRETL